MTYFKSAKGHRITWRRAIRELDKHGIPKSDHSAFFDECWAVYATDKTILATRVLEWLGY